jgi:hypothetical protein
MPKLPTEAELAPHGRDDDGEPLAPFGHLVNGRPRKSNRGARARPKGSAPSSSPSVSVNNATDQHRKEQLCALSDMFLVTGLATLSVLPGVANVIGENQADALAGDAVIVNHFMPAVADGLIMFSQTKPGMLGWLDTVEEKAPYLLLLKVGIDVTKALVAHHRNPDPRLNAAGRTLVQLKAAEMAAAVERQVAEFEAEQRNIQEQYEAQTSEAA